MITRLPPRALMQNAPLFAVLREPQSVFLFKTSGQTLGSVVANQKHAFAGMPRDWAVGELVLVSKNRGDCAPGERQIQYVMKLEAIRPLKPDEAGRYWPGTEGRWKYLVLCNSTSRLRRPFNLTEALGSAADEYAPVLAFKRFSPEHERQVIAHMLAHDPDCLK